MADDFRSHLSVLYSDEPTKMCYADIALEPWFTVSIQARRPYDDSPMVEGDPFECDTFHISLMTRGGVITYGEWGAWEELCNKPWASKFREDYPFLLVAEDLTVEETQRIYDDLARYAATRPAPRVSAPR
ncbi:MAG: hypothetical protein ACOCWR_05710 [Oceanidesulfovibrio sp.]